MSNFLLHHLITNQVRQAADSTALIHKDTSISYQQLASKLLALSHALKNMGIKRHDRLAVYLPKKIETVLGLFSASTVGAVVVPINPVLKDAQVQYILNDCNVRCLLSSSDRLKHIQNSLHDSPDLQFIILTDSPKQRPELPDSHISIFYLEDLLSEHATTTALTETSIDSDIAAILYTSGSTGSPKGVVLSHRNLVEGARSVSQYLENSAQDRILSVLPFSFDYGFSQLTTAFYVGASVVLLDYLLPRDVIKAVDKYQITGLAAVPPLWIQLAQLPWKDTSSLRYFTNSGGAMPLDTLKNLRQALPTASPYLMYGLTEAFRSTYVPPDNIDSHQSSIGIAIPNAEIMVLRADGSECADNEPGELVHRGVHVAQGYWNLPEKTARRFKAFSTSEQLPFSEKVVWSGDMVRRAEDGYLYFISRQDDMIKTSGYRVSPNEVEEVLHQSNLCQEVVALGVAHPVLGQAIVLVVSSTSDAVDIQAINNYCRKNLPNYMLPAKIFKKSALARNQNGKIDRNLLLQEYKDLFQDPV